LHCCNIIATIKTLEQNGYDVAKNHPEMEDEIFKLSIYMAAVTTIEKDNIDYYLDKISELNKRLHNIRIEVLGE